MRSIAAVWLLLLLFLLPLNAQNAPAVEQVPLDSTSLDSGDELDELDDIDVRSSQLPECLAGLFSHDTLVLGCELELLPQKIVVKTKEGDVVYKLAPQFLLDTTLDGRAREPVWRDVRQPQGRCAYSDGGLCIAGSGICDKPLWMAS